MLGIAEGRSSVLRVLGSKKDQQSASITQAKAKDRAQAVAQSSQKSEPVVAKSKSS